MVLPSLLSLVWVQLKPIKSLLVASLLLLVTILISMVQYFSTLPAPQQKHPFETTKEKLEQLHQQQPTHRDILINLARIHQAIGNTEKAQEYLDQAQKLDPNNPVFIQDNNE